MQPFHNVNSILGHSPDRASFVSRLEMRALDYRPFAPGGGRHAPASHDIRVRGFFRESIRKGDL